MTLDPHARPQCRLGLTVQRTAAGARLRDGDTEVCALNPTALALWELCDGDTAVEEIVDAVCRAFSVDEDVARHDVEATLVQLGALGVVTGLDSARRS